MEQKKLIKMEVENSTLFFHFLTLPLLPKIIQITIEFKETEVISNQPKIIIHIIICFLNQLNEIISDVLYIVLLAPQLSSHSNFQSFLRHGTIINLTSYVIVKLLAKDPTL